LKNYLFFEFEVLTDRYFLLVLTGDIEICSRKLFNCGF